MKKWVSLLSALAIFLTPVAVYAADGSGQSASGYVLNKKGVVDTTLREPGDVDWSTGKGRKDWPLHWAVDDNYLKKAPGMLVRGTSNTAFGWVEVLTHPFRWSRNSLPGVGLISGLIMGPIVAVLRTTSGALDVATFWVPFWHGVPMKKPALGLHDVNAYEVIEDPVAYNRSVKRFFFNGLSDEY